MDRSPAPFPAKEKEFTRLREELSRERRELPWERVEKNYVFEGPTGKVTLNDLFAGKSQLVVYHLMFAPDSEAACRGCSFWADNFNGTIPHLEQRDVSFVAISRAPVSKLQGFANRMGWTFKWVSGADGDFNYDYQASFRDEDLDRGTATIQLRALSGSHAGQAGLQRVLQGRDRKRSFTRIPRMLGASTR